MALSIQPKNTLRYLSSWLLPKGIILFAAAMLFEFTFPVSMLFMPLYVLAGLLLLYAITFKFCDLYNNSNNSKDFIKFGLISFCIGFALGATLYYAMLMQMVTNAFVPLACLTGIPVLLCACSIILAISIALKNRRQHNTIKNAAHENNNYLSPLRVVPEDIKAPLLAAKVDDHSGQGQELRQRTIAPHLVSGGNET